MLDPNDPTVKQILKALDIDTTHPGKVCLGDVWRMAQADNTDLTHSYTNASIRKAIDALPAAPTVDAIADEIMARIGTGGAGVTRQEIVDILNKPNYA